MIDTKRWERLLSRLLIFAFGFSLVFGAITYAAADKVPLVSQDLSLLKNSDGKIVDQKKVDLPPAFSDKVDCYKMKYLSDGLRVVGFMLIPRTREKRLPVLIFNRGGNRDFGSISQRDLVYLSYLSSKGYLVVASQYRGNDGGEGRESFGGKDVNDVMNLIPLARSLEFSDPDRIVMLGYSRGGMMTYLAIKNGAQIKAAAVVGGVTDIKQLYREREIAMKRVIEELVGTYEGDWKDRSAYYFPEKINVPVLILHGEDDTQVKVTQAKKFAEKLQELGKEHELIIFPKGDHGLNTHRSQRNAKILKFFAKHTH
jgi:dipeptidyl aminopeptidase/acylaminoacyl peptidase